MTRKTIKTCYIRLVPMQLSIKPRQFAHYDFLLPLPSTCHHESLFFHSVFGTALPLKIKNKLTVDRCWLITLEN